jgi:hypothetical protein
MFLPEFLNLLNIPLDKAGFLFGFFPFASLSSAFFEERDDASLLRVLRNVTRKAASLLSPSTLISGDPSFMCEQ